MWVSDDVDGASVLANEGTAIAVAAAAEVEMKARRSMMFESF